MILPATLNPAATQTLIKWHEMVVRNDTTGLEELVHPDATFNSPVAFKPYKSAKAMVMILSTVLKVFNNMAYHRQLASDDGLTAMLEFTADVNGNEIHGVDIIRFLEDGRIMEFQVAARPLASVQALSEEMGSRIGSLMAKVKA